MSPYPKVTHSLVNVIIVILYLGYFMVNCAGTPSGVITPEDPYPIEGETLRLNCTVKSSYKGHIDASTMNFKTNKKTPIRNSELRVLSNDTVQLIWYNLTEDQSGNVNCYMGADLLIATDVNIGPLPKEVKNVSCIIYNGESMNCSWCPDVIPLGMSWQPSYSVDGRTFVNFDPSSVTRCSCRWQSATEIEEAGGDIGDTFVMFLRYILAIDPVNIWGNKRNYTPTGYYTLDTAIMTVVKPNAVSNLAVIVLGSDSITVSWERPVHLPSSVQVYYSLRYTSVWTDHLHIVNGSGVGNSVIHTLTGLHPFTKYDISVICKPVKGGFPSEKSSKSATTEEAAPSAPPEMAQGSYRIDHNCNPHVSECDVTVMWKKIDKFHQNGDIDGYIVETIEDGKRSHTKNVTDCQAMLRLSSKQNYIVTVRGYNGMGESNTSLINLSISPKLTPQHVVAEISEDKRHVDVWWQKPKDGVIDSYTLFYCTQVKDPNSITVCDGDLESISVSGNATHARLTFQQQYLYSIAANAGELSSGMTGWLCLYHFEKDIPDVKFKVEDAKIERSLTVTITTDQTCNELAPTGRIVQYNISIHCTHGNNNCPESNTAVIPSYSQKHTFENLEPNTDYDITLVAVGNNKVIPKNATKHRTMESAPDSPPVDVTVKDVGCHYIYITWKPPPKNDWNADSLKYHVKYKTDNGVLVNDHSTTGTSLNLTDEIYGGQHYTINVAAATSVGSPQWAPSQNTTTSICAPSKMAVPVVDISTINNSQVQMKWDPPKYKNGPLKGYHVVASYKTIDGLLRNQSWNSTSKNEQDNFTMVCPDDVGDYLVVNYTICAVSQDPTSGQYFRGPPSDPASDKQMCKPESVSYTQPLVIGVSVAMVVMLIVVFICRQKYRDIKRWLGGGVPEEPPVVDFEKPDDLTSISTEPAYIDDWVRNLLFYGDSTPLIDENGKEIEKDDYSDYTNSGGSTGSRIFIKGFMGNGKSGDSSYVEGQEPTSSAGESEDVYRRGLPDTVDETAVLVDDDYNNITVDESELGNTFDNKAYDDQERSSNSSSSDIQSGKASDSDSKSSSCASSGIGQEASTCMNPLGSQGLFANLTTADLESSDSEDDGYRQAGMTGKHSCPNEFSQFEDIPGHYDETQSGVSSSNSNELYADLIETSLPQQEIQTIEGAQVPTQILNHDSSHSDSGVSDSSMGEPNNRNSLVDAGLKVCTTCRKGHDSNIKCDSTSPPKNRQKRIDSSCSDESIPMGVLDSSPSVNTKLEILPAFLNLKSNATSC